MRTAVERSWDFDQIIVGHDAVVENNGKDVLRTAFRWALEVIEADGLWHMRLRYLGCSNPAPPSSANPSACGTAMG
jgi:hypothetical protein